MMQHALRLMLTDRSWLQHNSYDTSVTFPSISLIKGLCLQANND